MPRIVKPFESWTSVIGRARGGGSVHTAPAILMIERQTATLATIVDDGDQQRREQRQQCGGQSQKAQQMRVAPAYKRAGRIRRRLACPRPKCCAIWLHMEALASYASILSAKIRGLGEDIEHGSGLGRSMSSTYISLADDYGRTACRCDYPLRWGLSLIHI